MPELEPLSRRDFLNRSLATAGGAAIVAAGGAGHAQDAPAAKGPEKATAPGPEPFPYATIGNVKLSRLMLGGNLVAGYMHCRDLKYVNSLFRAYMTEEKILETFKVAEEHGINTLFESGWEFVDRYNRQYHGHMQFIPHISVELGQSDDALADQIKRLIDSGAAALYVWGVSGDTLVKLGQVGRIAKAVELAKKHNVPVGVGGHSLQVPRQCENAGVPCDFYVKTLHRDDYPSATPKELREDFMWMDGGHKAFYDNMWCIDAEETVEFMKTVAKPWVAFKVLAAGAYLPKQGFSYAFQSGADLIAVGMLDFQIKDDCETARKMIERHQQRERPWRA
jgi:hypothetical protein